MKNINDELTNLGIIPKHNDDEIIGIYNGEYKGHEVHISIEHDKYTVAVDHQHKSYAAKSNDIVLKDMIDALNSFIV